MEPKPDEYVPEWVDKRDVACRQIRFAVRTLFEEADPIPLYSVVAAAHRVVADLSDHKQFTPEDLDKAGRIAANFFKHADKDPQGRLNIEPLGSMTQDILYHAIVLLQGLVNPIPFEAQIFWAWFMLKHPDEFEGRGAATDNIISSFPNLRDMPFSLIRQLFRFNQALNKSEPLPAWALLGPIRQPTQLADSSASRAALIRIIWCSSPPLSG